MYGALISWMRTSLVEHRKKTTKKQQQKQLDWLRNQNKVGVIRDFKEGTAKTMTRLRTRSLVMVFAVPIWLSWSFYASLVFS